MAAGPAATRTSVCWKSWQPATIRSSESLAPQWARSSAPCSPPAICPSSPSGRWSCADAATYLGCWIANVSGPSPIKIERVLSRVNEIIGVQRIEDLPIPFTAVATDLWARREVWFNSGPIDPAIRASIAIPGVFPPIALNGRLLVNGGVSNQVPVSVLASSVADLTVAVTLDGHAAVAQRGEGLPVHTSSDEEDAAVWTDRLRQSMGKLMEAEPMRSIAARMAARPLRQRGESADQSVAELFEELPTGLRTTDVATQSLEVLMAIVQRSSWLPSPPTHSWSYRTIRWARWTSIWPPTRSSSAADWPPKHSTGLVWSLASRTSTADALSIRGGWPPQDTESRDGFGAGPL